MELKDYRRLSTPGDCNTMQCKVEKLCNKMSIVYDHKHNHKVGGTPNPLRSPLAVSKGKFCAMFYHVSERKRDEISFKCLDKSECRVGNSKMTRLHSNPKAVYARTVVVYVRLTDQEHNLIFHARYGNCFQAKRRNRIHAEHFMLKDEEFKQYVKLLGDHEGGKIEMFMNKQPCFQSTRVKSKKCAQDLVNFYKSHCSPRQIKLTINLCQLYKVDMLTSPSLEHDIRKARQGMQIMMSAGIELKNMTKYSWGQLAGYAHIKLPEYSDSDRHKLDQHIADFLQSMDPQAELPVLSVEVHSQSTQH